MVVVYRVGPITYAVGKPLVHLDTYAMVNLVAGAKGVPELIQDEFTPEAASTEALRFLLDPEHAAKWEAGLAAGRRKRRAPGASRRAPEAVLQTAPPRRVAPP